MTQLSKVTSDPLAIIRTHLPPGWEIGLHENQIKFGFTVILRRFISAEDIWAAHNGAMEGHLIDLIAGALYGTFDHWQGAQPMADHFWCE